jgi:hypothetical protein
MKNVKTPRAKRVPYQRLVDDGIARHIDGGKTNQL